MPKKAASTKQTGGSGFTFEDKVSSYFACQLIYAKPPLDINLGVIKRIDYQLEKSWNLDDLLLTLGGDDEHKISISIKSNKQFTRNGFPKDFVDEIWSQWLKKADVNPFSKESDYFCLVSTNVAESNLSEWNKLNKLAIQSGGDRLVERIKPGQSSVIVRNIFDSLKCPIASAFSNKEDELSERINILRKIRIIQFDFEDVASRDESDAVSFCAQILKSGENAIAVDLWGKIQLLSRDQRNASGYLDLEKILQNLRGEFDLLNYVDYRDDWTILNKYSQDTISNVITTICGRASIDRDAEINDIEKSIEINNNCILIGESGTGKTALAKIVSQKDSLKSHYLWFDNELLNNSSHKISAYLNIKNDIETLLKTTTQKSLILIIDNLDRLNDKGISNLTRMLRAISFSKSPWKILITSQPSGWERFKSHIVRNLDLNINFELIEIKNISDSSIKDALNKFDHLKHLSHRKEFIKILKNLKIFDWVVSSTINRQEISELKFTTISDVISNVWEFWIKSDDRAFARSKILMQLGNLEGHSISSGMSVSSFDTNEQLILGDLEKLKVIKHSKNKLYFSHDMCGDWARYMGILQSDNPIETIKNNEQYIKWQNSIRLYSESLLDDVMDDYETWLCTLEQLKDEDNQSSNVSQYFIDGLIFSILAESHLNNLLKILPIDSSLLNQILTRFRHVGTVPDNRIPSFTSDIQTANYLSANMRVPIWYLWGSFLRFLFNNREILIERHLYQVAHIALAWLKNTTKTYSDGTPVHYRDIASKLAVMAAREMQAEEYEDIIIDRKIKRVIYEGLLCSFDDNKEEASALTLELCQLRSPDKSVLMRMSAHRKRKNEEHQVRMKNDSSYKERHEKKMSMSVPIISGDGDQLPAWPHGPQMAISSTFESVITKPWALSSLISNAPEIANEVVLAISIESPPVKPYSYAYSYDHDESCGLNDWHGLDRFYLSGPFYLFLLLKPDEAITTIVTLVDFATERSLNRYNTPEENVDSDNDTKLTIRVNSQTIDLQGDAGVYAWFCGLHSAPKVAAIALMALEKWFYDQIDAEKDVSRWIDKILSSSHSIAFIGLLCEVGKRQSSLFLNELIPVFGLWQVINWDNQIISQDRYRYGNIYPHYSRNGLTPEMVNDWKNMEHRRRSIEDIARYYFLNNIDYRETFLKLKEGWMYAGDAVDIRLIFEYFNIENYKLVKEDGGSHFKFITPKYLNDKFLVLEDESSNNLLVITFPNSCRKILSGERVLSETDLDEFYNNIKAIERMESDDDVYIRSKYASICGGIAVLLIKHRSWLRSNASKEKWCVDKLLSILTSYTEMSEFDSRNAYGDDHWDCFAGEASVTLLVEDPDNIKYREAVSISIISYHYSATHTTVLAAYINSEQLEDDFIRIVNLSLIWSGLSLLKKGYKSTEFQTLLFIKRIKQASDAFIYKTLPNKLLPLERIGSISSRILQIRENKYLDSLKFGSRNSGDRQESWVAGLNSKLLISSLSWLDNYIEKSSDALNILDEATIQLLQYTTHQATRNSEKDQIPHDVDLWIFNYLIRYITLETNINRGRVIWEPILKNSGNTKYWIEYFLHTLYLFSKENDTNLSRVFPHWEAMVEYCMSEPAWRPEKDRYSYDTSKLLILLLGMDQTYNFYEKVEFQEYIKLSKSIYSSWASNWLNLGDAVMAFSNALQHSDFKVLRWMH